MGIVCERKFLRIAQYTACLKGLQCSQTGRNWALVLAEGAIEVDRGGLAAMIRRRNSAFGLFRSHQGLSQMACHRCLVLLVGVLLGCTETAVAAVAEIQPVTHNAQPPLSSTPLPPTVGADQVTFAQQPARVGDRVAQSVGIELQLQTTITQQGQQAHEGQTSLKRRQQRFIEVLEIVDGSVRRAHVTYPLSRITSPENDDPKQEVVQPVEKQSYFVTREGERLLVTDVDGAIPSQAEFEIIVTSLQNLGLPNPLVKFLLHRTIRVGERLQLPQAIAEQLMGFGDQFGTVEQFELELKSVEEIDGEQCAVFASTIEAVGEASNPVRIKAFGKVIIQTETCRTVRAELSGPLTLSAVEHTPQGSFEYAVQGSMRLAVRAQYGHATQ